MIQVKGRTIIAPDGQRWTLLAAPIENDKRPGTYVAPAERPDGTRVALPMPADVALAWYMANT